MKSKKNYIFNLLARKIDKGDPKRRYFVVTSHDMSTDKVKVKKVMTYQSPGFLKKKSKSERRAIDWKQFHKNQIRTNFLYPRNFNKFIKKSGKKRDLYLNDLGKPRGVMQNIYKDPRKHIVILGVPVLLNWYRKDVRKFVKKLRRTRRVTKK